MTLTDGENQRSHRSNFNYEAYIVPSIYIYIYIYIHVIYKNSETHILVVCGNMFRPHCSHLQPKLYKSSAFNVRTIWDPIMCTIILYVEYCMYF